MQTVPHAFPSNDAVIVPNLGTLHRETDIHVALHALLLADQSHRGTLLASRGEIFIWFMETIISR